MANRTNVDLKDKYRTMAKNQELNADEVQSDYDDSNSRNNSRNNSAQRPSVRLRAQSADDSDSEDEY